MTTMIATDADATRITAIREQHRTALDTLRDELSRIDAGLSQLAADAALGEKPALRETGKLNERRAEIVRKLGTEQLVIDELGRRLETWRAGQERRTYEANLNRLRQISERTEGLEADFAQAARSFVAAASALLRHRREWQQLSWAVKAYANAHKLPGHGLRPPRRPVAVPERYVRQTDPYLPIGKYLDGWRQAHPG